MSRRDFCWGLGELSRNTATKAERVFEDNLIAALDSNADTNPNWFRGNDFQTILDSLATDTEVAESIDTALQNKADASALADLQTALGDKADASAITGLQTTLDSKADMTALADLQADLGGKADTSTVDAQRWDTMMEFDAIGRIAADVGMSAGNDYPYCNPWWSGGLGTMSRWDFCWGLGELSRNTATKAERVFEDNLIAALDTNADTNPNWFRGSDFQTILDLLATDTDDTLATDTDVQQVQANLDIVSASVISLSSRVQTLEEENAAMKTWICAQGGDNPPAFCQ